MGPTSPSISRKIQTSAATLITSGTVTKKPAMKLRLIQFNIAQSAVGGRESGIAVVNLRR